MKAYPHWFYQDPAKHVKFESEKKEPEEKPDPRDRAEKAKQELEGLFKEGKRRA